MLNKLLKKKPANKVNLPPASQEQEPRPMADIKKQHDDACRALGAAQYQVRVYTSEVDRLVQAVANLNAEAARRVALDAKAADDEDAQAEVQNG